MITGDIQTRINRAKPSRINVAYKIDTGGAQKSIQLPVCLLFISDLNKGKYETNLVNRDLINVDKENFGQIMENMSPTININVKNFLNPSKDESIRLKLVFKQIEDFEPHNVLMQNESTAKLYMALEMLRELLSKIDVKSDLNEMIYKMLLNSENINDIRNEIKSIKNIPNPKEIKEEDNLPNEENKD